MLDFGALGLKSDVTKVVIFFSHEKNENFRSKFWNRLRILIYYADKAGFWMGITKTHFSSLFRSGSRKFPPGGAPGLGEDIFRLVLLAF